MAVSVPSIDWPSELQELGPEEDPDIVLVGAAHIGRVRFDVVALRMRKGLRLPDFLADLPEQVYDATICEMLDEIEYLADSIHPARLDMDGAEYLLWMVPCNAD